MHACMHVRPAANLAGYAWAKSTTYVCMYVHMLRLLLCVCMCICLCVCSLDISCVYACINYCSISSPQCVSIVVVVVLSTVTSITATVHAHMYVTQSVVTYQWSILLDSLSLSLSHSLSLSLHHCVVSPSLRQPPSQLACVITINLSCRV